VNISPPVSGNDPGEGLWVTALITETPADTELSGISAELQRLCRAAAGHLGLTGATIRLAGGPQDVVVASSDPTAHRHAELQFDANEGPGHVARVLHRPVLVPDVQAMATRWPGLALLAAGDGLEAIFAFPLQEGAVSLGVLEVYGDRTRRLSHDEVSSGTAFARVATRLLLDGHALTLPGELDVEASGALERAVVYQAQGMVMVELGLPLPDALARLRARALAEGTSVEQVSRGVVEGTEDVASW
jgi:hypothetical protein